MKDKPLTGQSGISLTQLSERTGVPPRTIRFYIARGLLPGPLKAGRGAAYGQKHLDRIAEIRRLQDKGLTLSEIALSLEGGSGIPTPTSWHWYPLQPDVVVQVRANANPWRLRQIQKALKELNRRLGTEPGQKDENDDK